VLGNFTGTETFGARNTHRVKIRLDTHGPNVLVVEPQIVSANAQ